MSAVVNKTDERQGCQPLPHAAEDLSHAQLSEVALAEQRTESLETAGFHLVAFRVSAVDFGSFLDKLPGLDLINHRGDPVTADLAADHSAAYSIYFCDPFGHRLELTTYEYEQAKAILARRSG